MTLRTWWHAWCRPDRNPPRPSSRSRPSAVARGGHRGGGGDWPTRSIGTSAIVAEWASGRVLRVALTASTDGTTSDGIVEPILLGVSKPVGVVVAPDGSVIVGDWATGTIHRIAKA